MRNFYFFCFFFFGVYFYLRGFSVLPILCTLLLYSSSKLPIGSDVAKSASFDETVALADDKRKFVCGVATGGLAESLKAVSNSSSPKDSSSMAECLSTPSKKRTEKKATKSSSAACNIVAPSSRSALLPIEAFDSLPISVHFENQSPSVSVKLRDLLLSLDSLYLARLQSLIFDSTRSTGKIEKRDQLLVTIALDCNRRSCVINSGGLLVIPQFKDKVLLKKQIIELLESDTQFEEKKLKYNNSDREKKLHLIKEQNDTEVIAPKRAYREEELPQLQKKAKSKKASVPKPSSSLHSTTSTTVTTTLTTLTQTTTVAAEHESLCKVKPNLIRSISKQATKNVMKVKKPLYKSIRDIRVLSKFEDNRNCITPENYSEMFEALKELLSSGNVQYVALDCEMTSLYTLDDEEAHLKNPGSVRSNNTEKLINAAQSHDIFQLGLVIKTLNGEWSIWSINTKSDLSKDSLSPATLKFLFKGANVDAKLTNIRNTSIDPKEIISLLFEKKTTLVVFSGYVDLMHLLKRSGRPFALNHFDMEQTFGVQVLWDVKYIASQSSELRFKSLEFLVTHLLNLELPEEKLHDASFDALLTAMIYDYFVRLHSIGLWNFQGRLFEIYPQENLQTLQ